MATLESKSTYKDVEDRFTNGDKPLRSYRLAWPRNNILLYDGDDFWREESGINQFDLTAEDLSATDWIVEELV